MKRGSGDSSEEAYFGAMPPQVERLTLAERASIKPYICST